MNLQFFNEFSEEKQCYQNGENYGWAAAKWIQSPHPNPYTISIKKFFKRRKENEVTEDSC